MLPDEVVFLTLSVEGLSPDTIELGSLPLATYIPNTVPETDSDLAGAISCHILQIMGSRLLASWPLF